MFPLPCSPAMSVWTRRVRRSRQRAARTVRNTERRARSLPDPEARSAADQNARRPAVEAVADQLRLRAPEAMRAVDVASEPVRAARTDHDALPAGLLRGQRGPALPVVRVELAAPRTHDSTDQNDEYQPKRLHGRLPLCACSNSSMRCSVSPWVVMAASIPSRRGPIAFPCLSRVTIIGSENGLL